MRQTISRFGAIFAIVALGVGFLAGLLAATPDMYYSANSYFNNTHLYDLRVLGTLGLTSDDVKEISKIEGISDIMPSYYADALVQVPGSDDVIVTRFHSLPMSQIELKEPTGYINRIEIIEGRLPVRDDECVVVAGSSLLNYTISVGDTLVISDSNKTAAESLARSEFKVTGLAHSSSYFSVERDSSNVGTGVVSVQAYTGEQNFTADVYTEVYLTLEGASDYDSFSQEYKDLVQNVSDKIDEISGERCEIRYADVKQQAEETLADAREKYEDAKAEADEKLGEARTTLDDGQAQVAESEQQLEDAKQQIEDGEQQLSEQQGSIVDTLTDSQQQLIAGQQALIEAKTKYNDAKAELEKRETQVTALKTALSAAQMLVSNLQPTVAGYEAQIATLKPQLDTYQQALDAAQVTYLEAQKAVDDAIAAGGYANEEAFKEGDPLQAALLCGARDTALNARDTAQTRYDAASIAYNTVYGAFDRANSQLIEANRQIGEYNTQIADAERLIADGKAQLAAAQAQIIEGEKQVASGETSLSLAPDLARLQIELAQLTLESSKQQVEEGEEQLEEAKQQLEEGEKEYAEQKQSVEEQLADAEQQIKDGEKQLSELKVPEWYRLTRSENVSYASFESNVTKVEAVVQIFPVFFFLVAALVALTTMTRMVEEERLQIGTLKALGFSKSAIMFKYIFYALAASVAGSIFGLVVGLWLFPTVIWNAYTMLYTIPSFIILRPVGTITMAAGSIIACTLFATLAAAWGTLHESPAQLMRPRAPKAGKRILLERIKPIWSRMPFTYKVTARNLFRYKKRFLMTVVGIAGCTALLVAGFGLHDSISDIVNVQFGQIFTYDATATLRNSDAASSASLERVLSDSSVAASMAVHEENATSTDDGHEFEATILVPENDLLLPQFVNLRHRIGHDEVPFTSFGVVITEKMGETLGYGVGDSVQIENVDGKEGVFTVTGVAENYVGNYIYMPAELYEQQFGEAPEFTTMFIRLADDSDEAHNTLAENLLALDDVTGVSFVSSLKTSFSDMMSKIDIIVVVLIISAGVLAFVVLYNLTNININERAKEIATIKVLGFYDKEVYSYVYRETIVLSLIGTAVGLVLGIFLHRFVIYNVEVDMVMFGRSIKPLSYVFSAALTMVFSFLVELVMRKKLRDISMVESMKAPE